MDNNTAIVIIAGIMIGFPTLIFITMIILDYLKENED